MTTASSLPDDDLDHEQPDRLGRALRAIGLEPLGNSEWGQGALQARAARAIRATVTAATPLERDETDRLEMAARLDLELDERFEWLVALVQRIGERGGPDLRRAADALLALEKIRYPAEPPPAEYWIAELGVQLGESRAANAARARSALGRVGEAAAPGPAKASQAGAEQGAEPDLRVTREIVHGRGSHRYRVVILRCGKRLELPEGQVKALREHRSGKRPPGAKSRLSRLRGTLKREGLTKDLEALRVEGL